MTRCGGRQQICLYLNLYNGIKDAFHERRRLAWAATKALNPIFHSTAPEVLKVHLFRALVETVLLFGCESWVTPQSLADQIDASHRRFLRAAINIRWPQIVRTTDLYQRTGVKPASAVMRLKQLQLFGKAVRAEPLQWPISRVLQHRPEEDYQRRGSPPKNMWSALDEDIESLGLSFPEARQLALDTKAWRRRLEQQRSFIIYAFTFYLNIIAFYFIFSSRFAPHPLLAAFYLLLTALRRKTLIQYNTIQYMNVMLAVDVKD